MAKKPKQPLIFDWDSSPDEHAGFSEIKLPGYEHGYYLNFETTRYDHVGRVSWWIDIATPRGPGKDEKVEKVVMDFASDIPAAQRAAENTFMQLLKAPKLRVV